MINISLTREISLMSLHRFLWVFLLLLLCFPEGSKGQEPDQFSLDSLHTELKKENIPDRKRVDILSVLSWRYRNIQPAKGIEYGLQAEELAKKVQYNEKLGEIYLDLCSNYTFFNDIIKGYEYSLAAIKYCSEFKDINRLLLAKLVNNSLNPSISTDQTKVFLDTMLPRLKLVTDKYWHCVLIGSIGNQYREAGETCKADSLINQALDESLKNNYGYAAAINLSRKAIALALKGKYDSAIVLKNSTNAYWTQTGNIRILTENEIDIGHCYYKLYLSDHNPEHLSKAKEHVQKSRELALKMNYSDGLLDVYKSSYTLSKEEKKADSALYFLERYVALNDSLRGRKAMSRLQQIVIAQTEQLTDQQIKVKDTSIRQQKTIIYSSISLALCLLFGFFFTYRQRQTSEKLLLNILPKKIAKRLKAREHPIADHFEHASIVFIDMAGFTLFSQSRPPKETVSILNTIFTTFDALAEEFGLEKIKTIGDCYMAVAGVPERMPDHALRAAKMSLKIKEMMTGYTTNDGTRIDFRIGIDCGPVVAGVIGKKKFIYDLWGDAVNTASRMENTGIPGEIHCTDNYKTTLEQSFKTDEAANFSFISRGTIEVKGKGSMQTWLLGTVVNTFEGAGFRKENTVEVS